MAAEIFIPNSGIASDTAGKVSATWLRNTVSDRRIVTSGRKKKYKNSGK